MNGFPGAWWPGWRLPWLPAGGWRRGARGLLDLLFPPCCPLCRQRVAAPHQLCPGCRNQLPAPPENVCLRCGASTAAPVTQCGQCLGDPLLPDALYAAYAYDDPMTRLVHGFKFNDHPEWAGSLAELLWRQLGDALRWESPDLVLPVPLHPKRLRQRHYNQSALLAGELARQLHRPLVTNALLRIKMAPPQAQLGRARRRLNVRGVFRVQREMVAGRAILLVDDVVTTGSTVHAATRVLKRAGARRVAVVCLARTAPDRNTPRETTPHPQAQAPRGLATAWSS